MNLDKIIHMLRNPYPFKEEQVREARLAAADYIQKQLKEDRTTNAHFRRIEEKIISFTGNRPEEEGMKKRIAQLEGCAPSPILRYFEYNHLPDHLQSISKPFGDLAVDLDNTLMPGAEKSVALRKLLESKDAAVRAALS